MKVCVGDLVVLTGKTRHGRNRIRENGATAEVITVDGDGDILSRKMCVRHTLDPSMWRWIDLPEDEHMKVKWVHTNWENLNEGSIE